jgi:hypothetical protein
LGDRLLSAEEAEAFVRSPALRGFSGRELAEHGVPFVGHAATLEEESQALAGLTRHRRWRVRIDPPGIVLEAADSWHPALRQKSDTLVHQAMPEGIFLDWPGPTGWRESLPLLTGSLVDELRGLARWGKPAGRWGEYQSIRFILTGALPSAGTLTRTLGRHYGSDVAAQATIAIQGAPWVPAECVYQAWRRAQDEVRREPKARDRDLGPRALDAFRFVVARNPEALDPRAAPPSWEELLRAWNDENPGQPFSDRSQLFKAFHRCRETLFPQITRWEGARQATPDEVERYRPALEQLGWRAPGDAEPGQMTRGAA